MHFNKINGHILVCNYRNDINSAYTCDLTIKNPNGWNNFSEISGAHMIGQNNDDTLHIYRFAGSNTPNVPSIICKTFQYATLINLQQTEMKFIDKDSFKGCSKVSTLNLKDNKITKIDESSFVTNFELEILFLQNNQLTTLPENIFMNQQNLISLHLYGNEINDLPENIFNSLTNLEELDIGHNQIQNLKVKWFENLYELNLLLLDTNHIEELPKNIFSSLKALEIIWINNNRLKVIHADSIGFLTNLTDVYLSNNEINAINEEFIANTGVQRLDMSGNECASEFIEDNSISIEVMKKSLESCFDNYKTVYGRNVKWCKTIVPKKFNFKDIGRKIFSINFN